MEQALAYWVHNLDPVIFQFTETIAIRWYGLAYVGGFLIAFGILALYWKKGKSALNPRIQESLSMALILGVIVGGRLGYFLFYDLEALLENPLTLFQVWKGGMASHGGFIGVAVAILWTGHKHRINPLYISDVIATVAALGLMLGRIANFIRGELWGKISDLPWAVIFPDSAPPGMPISAIPPRHPSQIYEALLEGLLLFALMQWRFWSVKGREPQGNPAAHPSAWPGHLTGEFLVYYSLARIFAEMFREPDAALIMGLSRGSFYSIFLIIPGLALILYARGSGRRLTNR